MHWTLQVSSKVHFKTKVFLLCNSVKFVFFYFTFLLLHKTKLRCFITDFFWFIFVANIKNNWSAFKEVFDDALCKWIPFNFQWIQEKRNKNFQFDKHDNNKEWVDFESYYTIRWILQARSSILFLGYTQKITSFFPQRIFEVKINVNFYFHT